MPAGQGAVVKHSRRGVVSCLTPETLLPFEDASFDYICVAHGVEETPDLGVLLANLWRVTKPEGRIVIIASNRSGLWARSDRVYSNRLVRSPLRPTCLTPDRRAEYIDGRTVWRIGVAKFFRTYTCRSRQASICRAQNCAA